MKGPKFNARLVQANQQSDINLARALASLKGHVSEAKYQMLSEVVREYLHVLNFLQEENADPVQVNEAVSSLCASLVVEYLNRTIPKGTGSATMHGIVVDFIQDITQNLVLAVNTNYGTQLGLSPAVPAPADPPPGTLQ